MFCNEENTLFEHILILFVYSFMCLFGIKYVGFFYSWVHSFSLFVCMYVCVFCMCICVSTQGGESFAHVLAIWSRVCESAYICFLIFEPPPSLFSLSLIFLLLSRMLSSISRKV